MKLNTYTGTSYPFGCTKQNELYNFSLYSAKYWEVTLEINHKGENFLFPLDVKENKTGDIWHIAIDGLSEPFSYRYLLSGTYAEKTYTAIPVADPYSLLLESNQKNSHSPFTTSLWSVFETNNFNWEGDKPLNYPLSECIIYEMHVSCFTKDDSSQVRHKGTFQAIEEKIPYLQKLGITSIELMPVFFFNPTKWRPDSSNKDIVDIWGYNPLHFHMPHTPYSTGKGLQVIQELQSLVKALHKAKIEIILDVVFNHTGEFLEKEYTGLNALAQESYFILDKNKEHTSHTGCGNTIQANDPRTTELLIHALRYWVTEIHIDGFRFDLASSLTRNESGKPMPFPPFIEAAAKDPILANTKLIAEPWDAGNLRQTGLFPAFHRWAEWNDTYRDTIRQFILGTQGILPLVANCLSGNEGMFAHSARDSSFSINFITSHDGFTLYDLVSYTNKHNEANGENNQDGTNNNYSYNHSIEGETTDLKVQAIRKKQIVNMACLLLLSLGTPMILFGDEIARTQKGNNNTWNQDSKLTWFPWYQMEENKDLLLFWQKMIALRKQRSYWKDPSFFTGKKQGIYHIEDISWHGLKPYTPDFTKGKPMLGVLWTPRGKQATKNEPCLYMACNFDIKEQTFTLPVLPMPGKWYCILQTNKIEDFIQNKEIAHFTATITVEEKTIVLLYYKPE